MGVLRSNHRRNTHKYASPPPPPSISQSQSHYPANEKAAAWNEATYYNHENEDINASMSTVKTHSMSSSDTDNENHPATTNMRRRRCPEADDDDDSSFCQEMDITPSCGNSQQLVGSRRYSRRQHDDYNDNLQQVYYRDAVQPQAPTKKQSMHSRIPEDNYQIVALSSASNSSYHRPRRRQGNNNGPPSMILGGDRLDDDDLTMTDVFSVPPSRVREQNEDYCREHARIISEEDDNIYYSNRHSHNNGHNNVQTQQQQHTYPDLKRTPSHHHKSNRYHPYNLNNSKGQVRTSNINCHKYESLCAPPSPAYQGNCCSNAPFAKSFYKARDIIKSALADCLAPKAQACYDDTCTTAATEGNRSHPDRNYMTPHDKHHYNHRAIPPQQLQQQPFHTYSPSFDHHSQKQSLSHDQYRTPLTSNIIPKQQQQRRKLPSPLQQYHTQPSLSQDQRHHYHTQPSPNHASRPTNDTTLYSSSSYPSQNRQVPISNKNIPHSNLSQPQQPSIPSSRRSNSKKHTSRSDQSQYSNQSSHQQSVLQQLEQHQQQYFYNTNNNTNNIPPQPLITPYINSNNPQSDDHTIATVSEVYEYFPGPIHSNGTATTTDDDEEEVIQIPLDPIDPKLIARYQQQQTEYQYNHTPSSYPIHPQNQLIDREEEDDELSNSVVTVRTSTTSTYLYQENSNSVVDLDEDRSSHVSG